MTAGTSPNQAPTATCCICAKSSTEGTRDKAGRFVCAGCLELARQAIIARRARVVRARENAKLEAEIAKVESDNSIVLQVKSALDPALALLCPSCGRLLHVDVGACHACGYGLGVEAPPSRFSFLFRPRGPRPLVAPHLMLLDASALRDADPRLESALPWVAAAILWTASALAYRNAAAQSAADVLTGGGLLLLGAWLVTASFSRSRRTSIMLAIPAIVAAACAIVDPAPHTPFIRWTAMGACLLTLSAYVILRVRGVFTGLWFVAVAASGAVIGSHIAR